MYDTLVLCGNSVDVEQVEGVVRLRWVWFSWCALHDLVDCCDGEFVGRCHQAHRFVEAVALHPSARRQNRLSAIIAPTHAAEFQTLADDGLAGSLDNA